MSREQTRLILGPNFRTFKKSPLSPRLTDSYDSLLMHLYFDDQDNFDFIEFGYARVDVTLCEIHLFSGTYADSVGKVVALGNTVVEDSSGCYFPEVGISYYAPQKKQLEGCGVFAQARFESYQTLNRKIAEKRRLRREAGTVTNSSFLKKSNP